MKLLAISGSSRAQSTNTALLRMLVDIGPPGLTVEVIENLQALPVFSPDHEGSKTPAIVREFIERIARADGIIISSPEYVRAIPGGLKNAIDWLVSGQEIIDKLVALIHASHRGDDMLESLRLVLGTVTGAFQDDIFLRFPLISKSPEVVRSYLQREENTAQMRGFLRVFGKRIRELQSEMNMRTLNRPMGPGVT